METSYSGTNLGIVEIHNGGISGLLQFHRKYSVVSRVVLDIANQTLWADDDQAGDFLRIDGTHWTHIKWPSSAKGPYTLDDVATGPRLIGNLEGLWLALAGGAWTWDAPNMQWLPLSSRVLEETGHRDGTGLVGILPIGAVPLMIIRREGRFIGGRRGPRITLSDLQRRRLDTTQKSGTLCCDSGELLHRRRRHAHLRRDLPHG